MMLDTAIVGGGLCGLVLAMELHEQSRTVAVFEARKRPGGRILSVPISGGGTRVDLGPTWFWPESQPLMTRLVEELRLHSFGQHDSGVVLALKNPEKSAEAAHTERVHGGARRVAGGMASVIDALIGRLPADCLHLDHVLSAVARRENHVELHFQHGEASVVIRARRAVLAIPPRLLAERVRFEPALNEELRTAMHATPTWMAAQAKAVIRYEQPSWRTAGYSGNAFVQHEQAVFSEIFDACDADTSMAALGGFVALSPALRRSFRLGLPMLMSNQMTQVFGTPLEECEHGYQDWASEPHTCSSRDVADFGIGGGYLDYGHPVLRQPVWEHQLHFGGSETAERGGGYLEGALEAAHRIRDELLALDSGVQIAPSTHAAPVVTTAISAAAVRTTADTRAATASAARDEQQTPVTISTNAACLAEFHRWVQARQQLAFEDYRRQINESLAIQQREQLTQRAMLGAMERVFDDALARLGDLPFDTRDVAVERGRSTLTPQVQSAFHGFIQNLLDEIVSFNRASCALSNFPHEHQLSKEYEQTILRDIAAAWREFSLSANSLLLPGDVTTPRRAGYIESHPRTHS